MNEHTMRLNAEPFAMIERGEKTIELRLNDEKRQKFRVGDVLTFVHAEDENRTLKCAIEGLHAFPSFEALYGALPLLKCGYTPENVRRAKASDMDEYYSAQAQAKYGVLGIELRLLQA